MQCSNFLSLPDARLHTYHRSMNDEFECIGVCAPEPESGACAGCGRPMTLAALIAYKERKAAAAASSDQPAGGECASS